VIGVNVVVGFVDTGGVVVMCTVKQRYHVFTHYKQVFKD